MNVTVEVKMCICMCDEILVWCFDSHRGLNQAIQTTNGWNIARGFVMLVVQNGDDRNFRRVWVVPLRLQ